MEQTGGGARGQARACPRPSASVRLPAYSNVTSVSYLIAAPRAGWGRAQQAHEPDPPPPVGTGSLLSTAPGRRGVEPLARARVLPVPALPRYPGPLPGVVSWCSASPRLLDRQGSRSNCAYNPLPGGVYATVVDQEMDEVLLGRPLLNKLGFDLKSHLETVKSSLHGKRFDERNEADVRMSKISYGGMK